MGTDPRRTPYDHEPAYLRIKAKGGRGWDDLGPVPTTDSYVALARFLGSPHAPPPGTRALDLGCGGGQASRLLAERGLLVTGIDYSETAVELARENARAWGIAATFLRDDALTLATQATGSFGLVVDNHVLHCIVDAPSRAAVLAQIARVLVPAGLLASDTMSCEEGFDPERYGADPPTRVARNRTRIWVSEAELDQELRAAGFTVLHRARRHDPDDPPGTGACLETWARRG